ncbi:MAG: hypothetical protein ACRDBQ_15045 [Shewanella sp.]
MSNKAHELMVKGLLAEFPEQDQKKVYELAKQIKDSVEQNGDIGIMALLLVQKDYM